MPPVLISSPKDRCYPSLAYLLMEVVARRREQYVHLTSQSCWYLSRWLVKSLWAGGRLVGVREMKINWEKTKRVFE